MKATAGRALPIAPWLRGYDRAWLAGDVVGGLAAGAVVIPQAMAYATVAGLPAEVGLYTCMVPMAVYALLGGSRTLSVSTTSSTTSPASAGRRSPSRPPPSPSWSACGGSHPRSPGRWWPSSAASCWSRWPASTSTGWRASPGAVRAPDADRPLAGPRRAAAARRLRHRHHGVPGDPGRRPRRPPQLRAADRQRPGAAGRRPVVRGGGVPAGHAGRRRLLPDRDQPARRRPHPAQRAGHRRPGGRLRPVPRADSQRPPPGDPRLHGRHRRARADRPGRLRAVLAAQPHRVLGRRRHRGQRPGARAAARRPGRGAAHPAPGPGRADRVGLTELQPTPGDRDLRAAGAHTEPVPGLLVLRFDGPLYTANVRSANRKVVAGVDQHPGTEVLVLDATALAQLSITVIEQFAELERELGDRGVTLWVAALPPRALHTARQTPRWRELDQADRLYPTAGAAVRAFQAR